MDERPHRAGLDVLRLQLLDHCVAVQPGILQIQAEEPVVGAALPLAERQDAQPLHAVQRGHIAVIQRLFVGDEALEPLELGKA